LPIGAYFEIAMLDEPAHYLRYQGRSFCWIAVDEASQYPDPQWIDRLRSNLRGAQGVPLRFSLAANPGEVGHAWVSARYVFADNAPWKPYEEKSSGRTFVSCPSTYLDNIHMDPDAYQRQLEASAASDPELGRAWLEGD